MSFLLALLLCLSASAQPLISDLAVEEPAVAPGSGYYPTNIPGNIAYTYWSSQSYATNSGVAYLYDQTANGINLTNLVAQSAVSESSILNGYPGLKFLGSGSTATLWNDGYTAGQNQEIMLLASCTNAAGNIQVFWGATNASGRFLGPVLSINTYRASGISMAAALLTNQYVVFDMCWSNTVASLRTNGVLAGVTAGGQLGLCNGFVLGGGSHNAPSVAMSFIEAITYTNGLTASERTNVVSAIKSKYGL